jgi:hypothetical protein
MANLFVQIEKYDARAIDAEIDNLNAEIKDEEGVSARLIELDPAARLAAARAFITGNTERIVAQHSSLTERVQSLREMVSTNTELEGTDAEFTAYVNSESVADVSEKLAEINAMINQYHELLIETGREGRPPVF